MEMVMEMVAQEGNAPRSRRWTGQGMWTSALFFLNFFCSGSAVAIATGLVTLPEAS